jgi:hypothetical protein
MSPVTFVLLSGMLTFGAPLALAVYELLTLPGPGGRGGDDEPPRELFPVAPKPLPACLLPKPMPPAPAPRLRVLEDA